MKLFSQWLGLLTGVMAVKTLLAWVVAVAVTSKSERGLLVERDIADHRSVLQNLRDDATYGFECG